MTRTSGKTSTNAGNLFVEREQPVDDVDAFESSAGKPLPRFDAADSFANFDWNDLRFLLALARTGNAYWAGKTIGVTHSTVRRRIQSLEASVGSTLFYKNDDKFVLTPQGEFMVRHAEVVESTLKMAGDGLRSAESEVSGRVRIGAPDGIGTYFLASKLAKLKTLYPDLHVDLAVMSRHFDLSKREADIAIVIERPAASRHMIRKLLDCTNYLYASQEYLDSNPRIHSISDLKGHSFIGYTEQVDFKPQLDPEWPIYEELSDPRFASTNIVAQYRMAREHGGLCLLPAYIGESENLLRRVLPDEVSVLRELWLMIHADFRHLARCRVVAEFIVDEVRRNVSVFS